MHVVIPTEDLLHLLGRLKPLKTVTTKGFQFAIYTLIAEDKKLRLIISDGTSLTATTEVFATVKTPGKASVNGTDFYNTMLKIIPEGRTDGVGSKEVTLKVSGVKLVASTVMCYENYGAKIKQKREFTQVATNLSPKDNEVPKDYNVKIPGQYIGYVFKVMSRMISAYTSDMVGLSGILMRLREKKLIFAVSDGVRVLEIQYPGEIEGPEFDVLLPKVTSSLLHTLIQEGDHIEINGRSSRIKFSVNSNGLRTTLLSSVINAFFPSYESLFTIPGPSFTINNRILSDNITNVRRSLDDPVHRLHLVFNGKELSINNKDANSHMTFSNDGLPVIASDGDSFSVLINAFLLESLLSFIGTETIKITAPQDKPLVMEGMVEEIKVRAAIALAMED